MDDDQQQQCVQPDYGDPAPQVCTPPPPVCPMPADAPGPAPGDGGNPLLAPLPSDGAPDAGVPDASAGGSPDGGGGTGGAGAGSSDDKPLLSPTDDAGKSMVWDVLTMMPGMSAVATGIDLFKAAGNGIMGDGEAAKQNLSDAALDALGTIPGVGTALSAEELVWDATAGANRAGGATPDQAPTFSEAFYKGLPSWKDITSPFTDPDSWTPTGPAQ